MDVAIMKLAPHSCSNDFGRNRTGRIRGQAEYAEYGDTIAEYGEYGDTIPINTN